MLFNKCANLNLEKPHFVTSRRNKSFKLRKFTIKKNNKVKLSAATHLKKVGTEATEGWKSSLLR